jgi:hypothetical protein
LRQGARRNENTQKTGISMVEFVCWLYIFCVYLRVFHGYKKPRLFLTGVLSF